MLITARVTATRRPPPPLQVPPSHPSKFPLPCLHTPTTSCPPSIPPSVPPQKITIVVVLLMKLHERIFWNCERNVGTWKERCMKVKYTLTYTHKHLMKRICRTRMNVANLWKLIKKLNMNVSFHCRKISREYFNKCILSLWIHWLSYITILCFFVLLPQAAFSTAPSLSVSLFFPRQNTKHNISDSLSLSLFPLPSLSVSLRRQRWLFLCFCGWFVKRLMLGVLGCVLA